MPTRARVLRGATGATDHQETLTTVMAVNRHEGRLDAAAPLVLDTRSLGRRPGSLQPVQRTVPAPHRLGVDLVAVPEGGDLELELRLESVVEGVLVSGEVHAEALGECSRCLEPLTLPITVALTELYAYPGSASSAAAGEEAQDDEVRLVADDLLDLEPAITDALVLELPLQPLCREDCAGLCAECGERLAVAGPDHGHETMDPRWAALAAKLGSAGDIPAADHPSTSTAGAHRSSTAGASTDVEEK